MTMARTLPWPLLSPLSLPSSGIPIPGTSGQRADSYPLHPPGQSQGLPPILANLNPALSCPQILQAYLAFQDLREEAPVPYKRSLEEGSVVLNTLSPSSTTSPANPTVTGPNSLSYSSSAMSPYMTAPKAPRLAMMPDS